ncbi:TRI58 ligase, partial [Pedionomus torquatus]|nr:TRI58 ligase [Pedionomus torquatus]
VTLDPKTAHSELVLTEDLRCMRWQGVWQDVPDTPERFSFWRCVLGREMFQEGKHCWEVGVKAELGADPWWGAGVARESVKKKGRVLPSPAEGVWAVR